METPPPNPRDTQPMPAQPAFTQPPPDGRTPPAPGPAASPGGPGLPPPASYVHPFGNVGVYLLARLGAFFVDLLAVTFLFATIGLQLSTGGSFALGGHDVASFTLLVLASLGAAALLLVLTEGIFGTSLGKL